MDRKLEKIVEIVLETELYRKTEDVLEKVSNVAISVEAIDSEGLEKKIKKLPTSFT